MRKVITLIFIFVASLLFTGSTSTHEMNKISHPIEEKISETIINISDNIESETVVFKLHGEPKLKIRITNR